MSSHLLCGSVPYQTCAFSLHDALPIFPAPLALAASVVRGENQGGVDGGGGHLPLRDDRQLPGRGPHPAVVVDRKSTRLNSSHPSISYAVFCLKKKTSYIIHTPPHLAIL